MRIFWPAPTSKNHHIIPYPQAPNQSDACNIRIWPGETRCRIQEDDTPCGWIATNEDGLREHILKKHLLKEVRRRKRACKGLTLLEKTGGPTVESVLELIGLLLGEQVIQNDGKDKEKVRATAKKQVDKVSAGHFQKEGTNSAPVAVQRVRRMSVQKAPAHKQLTPPSRKKSSPEFDNKIQSRHPKSDDKDINPHGLGKGTFFTGSVSGTKRARPPELGTETPSPRNESNTKRIRQVSSPSEKRPRTRNHVQFKDYVSEKPTATASANPNSSFEVVIYSKPHKHEDGESNKLSTDLRNSHSRCKSAKQFSSKKKRTSPKTVQERVA